MTERSVPLEITEQSFPRDVLEATQPVLVDFWADWCAPCRAVAPAIRALASSYAGRATIAKLNVDEHPKLAETYGIRSIPAFLLFRNGEVVERLVGTGGARELSARLEQALDAA